MIKSNILRVTFTVIGLMLLAYTCIMSVLMLFVNYPDLPSNRNDTAITIGYCILFITLFFTLVRVYLKTDRFNKLVR